jgi:hypothetical protein
VRLFVIGHLRRRHAASALISDLILDKEPQRCKVSSTHQ